MLPTHPSELSPKPRTRRRPLIPNPRSDIGGHRAGIVEDLTQHIEAVLDQICLRRYRPQLSDLSNRRSVLPARLTVALGTLSIFCCRLNPRSNRGGDADEASKNAYRLTS